jgi:uncharacterized phosphosugar-binding protein
MNRYIDDVHSLINQMTDANANSLPEVAAIIAQDLANGGVLHVFGSGHSSLLAQEVFYRAGGLAPVNAMLDINLTVFGTSRPTWVERLEGYADSIFASYDVRLGEVLLVISNSGINPVPIDMAIGARARGLIPIAVGSAAVYAAAESRHSSGSSLFDIADHVLDTCVPYGDAITDIAAVRTGAVSTLLGSALLNLLTIEIVEAMGADAPVFVSQNIPGGDGANVALVERYRGRIPLMKP